MLQRLRLHTASAGCCCCYRGVAELGAAGLGTVLFQFSLGFFASLIFATTPKVADAMASRDYHEVGGGSDLVGMTIHSACASSIRTYQLLELLLQ
jgi:hypothetical protein